MLFKINDTILFRQYENYGYITDNSMFGYRMLNSERIMPGERYVSKSGAVMLGALTKNPQEIYAIVKKLMNTFYGADEKEIMDDAISFYLVYAD